MMLRLFTLGLAVMMMAGGLAACGKKGKPEAPPGSTYPQTYPNS